MRSSISVCMPVYGNEAFYWKVNSPTFKLKNTKNESQKQVNNLFEKWEHQVESHSQSKTVMFGWADPDLDYRARNPVKNFRLERSPSRESRAEPSCGLKLSSSSRSISFYCRIFFPRLLVSSPINDIFFKKQTVCLFFFS